MRKTLDITTFQYGIFSKSDAQDIPINSASDSDMIDGDRYDGKLGGWTTSSNYNALGFDCHNSAWIKRTDSKWDLIYNTTAGIKIIKDFYGTPAASSVTTAYNAPSIVVQNLAAHIGVRSDSTYLALIPQWIGWITYGQFGGAAPSATELSNYNAELTQPTNAAGNAYVSSVTKHAGTSIFDETKIYEYTTSHVYDGYQESPLNSTVVTYTPAGDNGDYVSIVVTIATISSLNDRVNAVKVYRREKDTTTGNYTLWRKIATLDITGTTGTTERGEAFTWGGTTTRTTTITDYLTYVGATYEEETGMPETLTSSMVYYQLATDINNYMFVANAWKTGIPDASRYLFRSKAYRYDMFDWSNDYVVLPTIPLAMKSFSGRLFVWDENNTYIINPETLEKEEDIQGAGCLSMRSVTVTEYGMFWCDKKNAYHHDGSQLRVISEPIKSTDVTKDWHGFTYKYSTVPATLYSYTPITVFCSAKNIVMFIIPDSGVSYINIWAYNVVKKRWDKGENFEAAGNTSGAVVGRQGEVYLGNGTNYIVKLFATATSRTWTWYSQQMVLESAGQKKAYYHLIVDYTGTVGTIQYSIDNGSNWSSLTNTTEIKDVSGNWEKQKTLKVKLSGTGIVNNIQVVYRRFIGARD